MNIYIYILNIYIYTIYIYTYISFVHSPNLTLPSFQNQESCWANALVAVAGVWVQGGASWNHRFTVQASFDSANGDGVRGIFVSTHIAEAKCLAQIALAKKIWTKMTQEKDGLLDTLS